MGKNNDSQKVSNKPSDEAVAGERQSFFNKPLEIFIGRRSAHKLEKIGLHTVNDLIWHVPFRLAQRGELMPIAAVRDGDCATVVARVLRSSIRPMRARKGYILTVTLSDGEHELGLTFFSKNPRPLKFHEMQLQPGTIASFSGTISTYRGSLQLTHPDYQLIGDASALDETSIVQPIPIYHAGASAPSWKIGQAVDVLLHHLSEDLVPDPLPETVRGRHHFPSKYEALLALHHPQSTDQWVCAKKRMAYEEALVLQTLLSKRRLSIQTEQARAFPKHNNRLVDSFDAQLPFKLTPGQVRIGQVIAHDLASNIPMRRLLQGDVGTGKTVVALRAMLQVAGSGGQAVLLAPTSVLAQQHYETLQAMLGDLARAGQIGAPDLSIRIELLTGALSARDRRETLARIASGQSQLIVGTHALLDDTVQIPFLGLLVVDEQHRFGVNQRDKLAHSAHMLVMTATPIPRTIAMTTFGDLDVSTLKDLPQGRAPIETVLVPASNSVWMARVWERAREEIDSGGRVYVVCPRIDAQEEEKENDSRLRIVCAAREESVASESGNTPFTCVKDMLQQLRNEPALEGISVGYVHGRMDADAKAEAMHKFECADTPILVATTVIEVGIDVPQASMMVIMDADFFGLSQLHQLRGRIGRSNRASICLAVHRAVEGTTASLRLQAFSSSTDGFALAEKDLELRSEGDVLGAEQSGAHSSLRFLSVVRDASIIEEAKKIAHTVIGDDPQLDSHPALREAVEAAEQTARADYIGRS